MLGSSYFTVSPTSTSCVFWVVTSLAVKTHGQKRQQLEIFRSSELTKRSPIAFCFATTCLNLRRGLGLFIFPRASCKKIFSRSMVGWSGWEWMNGEGLDTYVLLGFAGRDGHDEPDDQVKREVCCTRSLHDSRWNVTQHIQDELLKSGREPRDHLAKARERPDLFYREVGPQWAPVDHSWNQTKAWQGQVSFDSPAAPLSTLRRALYAFCVTRCCALTSCQLSSSTMVH